MCVVALIDALRDFIRCHDQDRDDLLADYSITREQAYAAWAPLDLAKSLLAEFENNEVDPSLYGLRRRP